MVSRIFQKFLKIFQNFSKIIKLLKNAFEVNFLKILAWDKVVMQIAFLWDTVEHMNYATCDLYFLCINIYTEAYVHMD